MKASTRNLLIGTATLALVALVVRGLNSRQRRQHSESQLDEALDGSFPASDPPATQDFAIPVNRA
jgi:hypothetical protein